MHKPFLYLIGDVVPRFLFTVVFFPPSERNLFFPLGVPWWLSGLRIWCCPMARVRAVAIVHSLAWELVCAVGAAKKTPFFFLIGK